MKTFREYLNDTTFEEVWKEIVSLFSEPEAIKPVYADYFERLKALPKRKCKGFIDMTTGSIRPQGMNAAPDFLIDKKVRTGKGDYYPAYITAILLYWASLISFHTSKEHDDDLSKYLHILETDKTGRELGSYLMESMSPDRYRHEKEESLDRKEHLLWDSTLSRVTPEDWRGILYVLKQKLEYDMCFMRGFADHAGREHDADRVQLCCNLIDRATADIYPDDYARRCLHLLFQVLDQNITNWSD